MRDYVGIAIEYAARAADPRNCGDFNLWTRLAAQRFLNDLARAGPDGPFWFSAWHACEACDFIEALPHVAGEWETPTIVLHESDVWFVVQLFGFRLADGTRRFTMALKAIARKNAKSTVGAGIALYCQVCEGHEGPQVISAATTYDQAAIVFTTAKRMVEKTADLRAQFSMEAFSKSIASYSNGGSFKALHAKASTQDGLNPSCVVLDEIHAHKDHDLINVLKSAAGARKNVLFLYLTTEGYDKPGPWAELREFMKSVLRGPELGGVMADHFLCVYYALDEEDKTYGVKADDDFDERAWGKANPLMSVNPILRDEIRKAATEARAMPGTLSEFRIKRLNRPASVAGGWVDLLKWRACGGAVDLEWLRQYPCWGGLDLANVSDLTSFRLVWSVDGVLYTHGWRFVPRVAVDNRTARGMVPYSTWVQRGHLIVAGDEVTDHGAVEKAVLEARKRFNLQKVCYDGWNAAQLAAKLKDKVAMEEFIQGPKSYHPAMKALEVAYYAGNLRHAGDPVLAWCAANIVARKDVNLNMAPDKKKSADKIDDMSALCMAVGGSLSEVKSGISSWLKNPLVHR